MNFKRAAEAGTAKLFVKDVRVHVDSETVLTRRLDTENNIAVSAEWPIYANDKAFERYLLASICE